MNRLDRLLANRAWLRREDPFPHVVARDVFTGEFYRALAGQIDAILVRGLSETPAADRFSRNIPGYDSYGIGFDRSTDGPLALFHSIAWRDLMSGLFGIGPTPYVFGGAHHHAVGSANGFIHNDFNPVWFPRATDRDIVVPEQTRCTYTRGDGPLADAEKIQVVRGAVVLVFLLNDGWRAGDGGEMGLFCSSTSSLSAPAAACAPLNNSLVAFECTPRSFHAFLTNRRLPRTSIIMWVHRTLTEATNRFGEDALEQWKR
jgi:2-oxoglutarate-Fe(II)-dependent oxygenase superfamily protein